MKYFIRVMVAVMAMYVGWAGAQSKSDDWIAKVNGVVITQEDAEALQQRAATRSGFKLRESVVTDQLIMQELLAQEGLRQGMDKNIPKADVALKVYTDFMKANPLGDSDVVARYEKEKQAAQENAEKEYRFRHILVKTEDKAKAIIDDLQAGKSFSSLVAQSVDTQSAKEDGRVDWMRPDAMDLSYAIMIKTLKQGEYTKRPIRINDYYSVVILDEVRSVGFPELNEVGSDIAKLLVKERLERLMKPLEEKAIIERRHATRVHKIN